MTINFGGWFGVSLYSDRSVELTYLLHANNISTHTSILTLTVMPAPTIVPTLMSIVVPKNMSSRRQICNLERDPLAIHQASIPVKWQQSASQSIDKTKRTAITLILTLSSQGGRMSYCNGQSCAFSEICGARGIPPKSCHSQSIVDSL